VTIVVFFGVPMAKRYRGDFVEQTELVVVSDRAGLVVDPGSKVTLDGVEIGRVAGVDVTEVDGHERALIALEVKDEYSTVFGNKYVPFMSPESPSAERLSPGRQCDSRRTEPTNAAIRR